MVIALGTRLCSKICFLVEFAAAVGQSVRSGNEESTITLVKLSEGYSDYSLLFCVGSIPNRPEVLTVSVLENFQTETINITVSNSSPISTFKGKDTSKSTSGLTSKPETRVLPPDVQAKEVPSHTYPVANLNLCESSACSL